MKRLKQCIKCKDVLPQRGFYYEVHGGYGVYWKEYTRVCKQCVAGVEATLILKQITEWESDSLHNTLAYGIAREYINDSTPSRKAGKTRKKKHT